jgi:hypothetical protein
MWENNLTQPISRAKGFVRLAVIRNSERKSPYYLAGVISMQVTEKGGKVYSKRFPTGRGLLK